jgi:hypothetical protein
MFEELKNKILLKNLKQELFIKSSVHKNLLSATKWRTHITWLFVSVTTLLYGENHMIEM